MCAPPHEEHVPPGPPIAAPSRPDQPASHVPPVPQPDDPLANVKVPCLGINLQGYDWQVLKICVQEVIHHRTG